MRRNAFTLIELLAVIVILAVIALIAVPIVMKMIDNATRNSYRRSIDLYGGAVNNAIIEYQTDMVEKGEKTNVTFENTTGWFITSSSSATSGTNINVTNPSTNATNLKSTYADNYWKRNT